MRQTLQLVLFLLRFRLWFRGLLLGRGFRLRFHIRLRRFLLADFGRLDGHQNALARNVDDDGGLTRLLPVLVFARVVDAERRVTFQYQLALLVLGPDVELDGVLPVLAVAIADAAFADQRVAGPDEANELGGEPLDLRAARPVGDELAQEALPERRRRIDARHAQRLRERLVDVQRVKVSCRSGVARELH